MAYNTPGILSPSTNVNKVQGSPGPASVPQSGVLLFQQSATSLTANTLTNTYSNVKNPNNLPMSNLNIEITRVDTTSSTTPTGVNSVDTTLLNLIITGSSGRQLCNIHGNYNEFVRWQHRLNPNGYYVSAVTPADSTTATTFTGTMNFAFKNWIIDPSEFPLSIQVVNNTLASIASATNSATATLAVTGWADFVPVASYKKAFLRTTLIPEANTGVIDLGKNVDESVILDLSLDVGADTDLSHTNTFYVSVNNNAVVPNSDYQTLINAENANYPITTPHIAGFFPFGVSRPVVIDGTQAVSIQTNFASAPSGGGQSNSVNMYEIEAY